MLLLIVCLFCVIQGSHAQCSTPISVFPYTEGFEATNGGWTPGGAGSDWAWGTPSKPTITGAAGGTKCWITGGLAGSAYSNGEASWLQSPCFDFSTLVHPYISIAVFWETERKFDGANLQYSTDLGSTWTNVGSISDPVNCLNDNWYNYSPISGLNPVASIRDGWSGTVQPTSGSCQGTGGSGRWVNAQHTMPGLAGVPNVIFRFTFGAGTVCNNFDGFAVDDIKISEAPPNNASFTYSCTTGNAVAFTNTSALCPATKWKFGDPASGANDSSDLPNPTHTFSGPGTYTITLNAIGPDNASSTTQQTIHILGLTTSINTNISCFGDKNGSATVNVIPAAAAPFIYSWNTSPVQTTPTATGLGASSYSVTVSAINSCQASAIVTITEPAKLSHTVNIIQPGCSSATGTATVNESGGTAPYTYSWNTSPVQTTPTATGLTPGNYAVTVTDNNLCTEKFDIVITTASAPTISITNIKNVSCFGLSDGAATAQVSGGNPPYTYSWNTVPVQSTATANNLAAGNYSVTATDNNGCSASASTTISQPASGSCGEIYFPNSFTPNGDSKNEGFGPLGNLSAISNYQLAVFNRYGELVFSSKDPNEKWNGYYRSKLNSPGSYVWFVSYLFKGQFRRADQGSVTVIR